MHEYTLSHVSDAALLRDLGALIAQERVTTATLLAHIAEVDARRLYVPAGYPSMHAFCVDELRLSEDAAYKGIQAARAARQFPALFSAVAEGKLHLAGVCLLAPRMTLDNAEELIEAVTNRRKSEIEELLARRFAAPKTPFAVQSVHAISLASLPGEIRTQHNQLAPGQVQDARCEPSPELFLLQVTIGRTRMRNSATHSYS